MLSFIYMATELQLTPNSAIHLIEIIVDALSKSLFL